MILKKNVPSGPSKTDQYSVIVYLYPEKYFSFSKQPRVKTRGIAASGYTRPTSSDNFIYGLKPVELRRKIKF